MILNWMINQLTRNEQQKTDLRWGGKSGMITKNGYLVAATMYGRECEKLPIKTPESCTRESVYDDDLLDFQPRNTSC
jgi:hypothetical protein